MSAETRLRALATRLAQEVKALRTEANGHMRIVNHGAAASTPRPKGALAVYWIGTVAPNEALEGDLWAGGA